MRALAFPVAALALVAASPAARADTSATAPPGPSQPALAVAVSAAGIQARACRAEAGCSAAGAAALAIPDDVTPLLGKARARSVTLTGGRHLVRVDVDGSTAGSTWIALLAAPADGRAASSDPLASGADPLVVWSGWTGLPSGEYGEGKTSVVVEDDAANGARRIVIGEQRDDVTLCGRPAIVAARSLDPATMTLKKGAAVQNLTAVERASAARLFARKLEAPLPAALPLLHATAASSAVERRFATLTDGDPESIWSEAKSGDGAGEFVTIASAPEVGITSLELTVRPQAEVPAGAAPRTFFLATQDRVFAVTMPDDGWARAGARYAVDLPEPLRTSCLALVLDTAYARGTDARVSLAELTAHTAFDGTPMEGLAGALAGGGDRASSAAALLQRSGDAGARAVITAYPSLDEAGKGLALDVIESAPCPAQVPFFAGRLEAWAAKPAAPATDRRVKADPADTREIERARDRLRRCGRASVNELQRLIAKGPASLQGVAAEDLALIAPDDAVTAVLDALASADDAARAALRATLARAAKRDRARAALSEQMQPERFHARPAVARIDALRAVGPVLPSIDGSRGAFADLAQPGADFRTRYLLLGPAGELARGGDPAAETFLRAALRSDADPHVRGRAAEAAGRVPTLAGDLVAAVDDAEVRVRKAAIHALASAPPEGTLAAALGPALVRRLASDPWPFIRAGSAEALAALPPSAAADAAIAVALEDPAPDVRAKAADALGAHRATAHAEPLRARSGDKGEIVDVRVHALYALAALCDRASIDTWTHLAAVALQPENEADRRLGAASIAALGALHPADLAARLAPLLAKDAPQGLAEAAKAALAAPGQCGGPHP